LIENDTPVNTIIIDIFMPGLGSMEGVTRVHEKWPDAKIVAISGGSLPCTKKTKAPFKS